MLTLTEHGANNYPKKNLIDMHIHTTHSFCGKVTLEETLIRLSGKVDGITITDHDIITHYSKEVLEAFVLKYQIRVLVPSVEITTYQGDLLAYGLSSAPSKSLDVKKVIEMIHNEGGIAVAPHPFGHNSGLGDLVYSLELDALEINGNLPKKNNQQAKVAAQTMGLPLVGGSDSHSKTQVGTCATEFPKEIKSMTDLIRCVKRKKCQPVLLRHLDSYYH
ncbi:MAG: hypothetical protein GF308_12680 [Candidatus Heimdallarchaeota archaeon]|nr:hypothetical protein [Candidatus Heimdallarchaeota archaeon]